MNSLDRFTRKGYVVDKIDLENLEIVGLDLDIKIKLLETIAQQLLGLQAEFASISGRFAELKASITVLKEVKSALQSAIRAERSLDLREKGPTPPVTKR